MSETASSAPPRRRRLTRLAAGCAVLAASIGYVVAQQSTGSGAPGCTVRASGGDGGPVYELSNEQAANAATISAVGTARGLPERAVTIALATALQESGLRNIRHGDRDSLGLFQQRPSKGWGTSGQIMDPVYSAGKFYDGLAEVPGYSRLPLTVAAQKVQRSGFPQAYAKHEPNAALLSAALTGRAGAALRCVPGGDGKAGDPARVRAELVRAFGPSVLPKGAAGAGTGTEPARGRGPAGDGGGTVVTVPVRGPADGTPARPEGASAGGRTPGAGAAGTGAADERSDDRGWEVAHWAVARAERLRIAEVSYGGRVWRSGEAEGGWREAGTVDSGARTAEAVRIRLAR
ncbi:hypothetical protein ABZ714_33400 [Streptomyces sp. NPDC006798]|uniref:hypothetical protein n=1 Tax=Streptomyces sp. NPDC006798 TaxID=3155462 RepID=UPI0033C98004